MGDSLGLYQGKWHSQKRMGLSGFAGERRRQSRLAALADKADAEMQHFMDEALADVGGWME